MDYKCDQTDCKYETNNTSHMKRHKDISLTFRQ